MIELPEAQSIAKQLSDTISGKTIKQVVAAQSPHAFAWYVDEPETYNALLSGKSIGKAYVSAGYLEIPVEDIHLMFHDGTALVCTVQMYGGLYAFFESQFDSGYYRAAIEKPSPLSDAFNQNYFRQLVSNTPDKLSIKAFLTTEQRIPGLGNGCLQDILFNADINPQTKLARLDDDQIDALYQSVKKTLATMTAEGGRNTEKNLFGQPGGYQRAYQTKRRQSPISNVRGRLSGKPIWAAMFIFARTVSLYCNLLMAVFVKI